MSYKVGDLVVCCVGRISDIGAIGIVTAKVAWYKGADQMLVVLSNGKKNNWYTEHVRLADEKDRLSQSKRRA